MLLATSYQSPLFWHKNGFVYCSHRISQNSFKLILPGMDRAQQDTWNSQISNQKRLKSNDSDDEHRKIKRHKRSCSKETFTKHQESSKSDDECHKSSRLKEMSTKHGGSSDSDEEHHKSRCLKKTSKEHCQSSDSDNERHKIKHHKSSRSKKMSTKCRESSNSDDERHKRRRSKKSNKHRGSSNSDEERHKIKHHKSRYSKKMSKERCQSSDSDDEHHKIKYHQSRRSKKKSKEHRYFEASPRQSTSDYAKKRHDIARSERRFDEYNVALNNLKHASTDFNEHHGRRLTSSAGDANVIVISDSDGGDPNQNVIVVTSSPEMDKIQGSILQNFFVISAAGIPLLNQKFIV